MAFEIQGKQCIKRIDLPMELSQLSAAEVTFWTILRLNDFFFFFFLKWSSIDEKKAH